LERKFTIDTEEFYGMKKEENEETFSEYIAAAYDKD